MAISRKVKKFMADGSWVRKMFEEGIALGEKYGKDNVFDLSLGNPIIEPPQEFLNELRKIAEDPPPGIHRYMVNEGYLATRTAVAAQQSKETGLVFTPSEIVMTCGAGGALNVTMKSLLNPGDEVVIFAPYFVEYVFYADNHGASCRVVPPDTNFLPNMEEFRSSVTRKTRIVLINSPNNPTGVVYGADVLAEIGKTIRDKEKEYGTEIYLLSDEPYRKILFDGIEYPQVYRHHTKSIVATSHSKDLALAGERIGFIAVNPKDPERKELIGGLKFCNRALGFVNAPALMQHIVKGLQSITVDIQQYQNKRDFLYRNLTAIGYTMVKPQGAFFMFPKSPIKDDVAFVEKLRQYRVLVAPGRGFGVNGHFRIAYCVEDQTLEKSLAGFSAAYEELS